MPRLMGRRVATGLLAVLLVATACVRCGPGYTALRISETVAVKEPFTEEADVRKATVAPTTETPLPLATATETATAISTEAPATATSEPTQTAVAGGTYKSAFVKDVTIPDGMVLEPGVVFGKKWAVRNSGSAAWGTGVKIRFVKGTNLATEKEYGVPEVEPGAQGEIVVPMAAPTQPGQYRSVWQLCRAEGCFGTMLTAVIVSRDPNPPTATRRPTRVAVATRVPTVRRAAVPAPAPAPRACCKICRKGCACGDTCISCNYTCHVGPGCACDG